MDIFEATRSYESWLGRHTPIVRPDLRLKHERLAENPFVFLRGTFLPMDPAVARRVRQGRGCAGGVVRRRSAHRELRHATSKDGSSGASTMSTRRAGCRPRRLVQAGSQRLPGHRVRTACTYRRVMPARRSWKGMPRPRHRTRPVVLAEHHRWLRRLALNELRDPGEVLETFADAAAGEDGSAPQRAAIDVARSEAAVSRHAARGRRGQPGPAAFRGARRMGRRAGGPRGEGRCSVGAGVGTPRRDPRDRRRADPEAGDPRPRSVFRNPFGLEFSGASRRNCSRIELGDLPGHAGRAKAAPGDGLGDSRTCTSGRTGRSCGFAPRPRRWLAEAALRMTDAVDKDWRAWQRGRPGR